MGNPIVQPDRNVMNSLYKGELGKLASEQGVKVAGAEDPQAFTDHAEYEKTVENVLSEDKKQGWDPNDPLKD